MVRSGSQLRDAIIAHLRQHHADMCRRWFDDIEMLELDAGTLKLIIREPVQLKYLQRCCVDQFTEAAQAVSGRLLGVRFVGDSEPPHRSPGAAGVAAAGVPGVPGAPGVPVVPGADRKHTNGTAAYVPRHDGAGSYDDMLLSPDFSFDTFVVGPGNRLAHAAAVAVAKKPGRAYNPFFIHGGVGLGKTHLLQAICQVAMRQDPGTRIYYTSCNSFMNQFMSAVQDGQMTDFRHRFRDVDVLLIDDIHDLSKRDRTQEEFFHTFNSLYQAGRQIVLSSDAAPTEIPDLEERLSSRFNSGLVARIDKPCFETRVAILKTKAAMRQIELPDDVASYIASKIESHIRDLEGAITTLQGLSAVNACAIDIELARRAFGDNGAGSDSLHPSIQEIIDAVTRYYDVKLTDLLSKRRHKSIALPRQICMWLARRHTRYSLEEIGGYFGGRDHTTVMHAIRAINSKRNGDVTLDRDVTKLESQLVVQVA